jgi:hypothetical protein
LNIAIALAFLVGIIASGYGQAQKPHIDIENLFTPSGWMGDGGYGRKYIEFSGTDQSHTHAQATSNKVTYTFGPQRWGGIYWQNVPDNWGGQPGSDFSGKEFSKITFWARGETGSEVVEFKAGGIDGTQKGKKYKDSFMSTLGRQTLTKDWKQYSIDLTGQNLKSVIGGFCWVASADYNQSKQITFYLEEIQLE